MKEMCLLFLDHHTFVYNKLYFADKDDIDTRLSFRSIRYCGKVSDDVLKKINDGAHKSEWIKPVHMKYFK